MSYYAKSKEELVELIEQRERMAARVRELRESREKALVKERDHLARTAIEEIRRANERADRYLARFDERKEEIVRLRARNRELEARCEVARLPGRTPAYYPFPAPAAKATLTRTEVSEYDEVRRELEEFDAAVRRMKRQVEDFAIARAALVARLNVLKAED